MQQDLTQRRRLDRRRERTDSTFWRQNLLGIMAAIKGQQHPPQANGWYLNIELWKIIRFYYVSFRGSKGLDWIGFQPLALGCVGFGLGWFGLLA